MKPKLVLVLVVVGLAWTHAPGFGGEVPRTAVGVEPILRGDSQEGVNYLEIQPVVVEIPAGRVLDYARLTVHGNLEVGQEVELWLGSPDALPWDSLVEGQRRLRSWVVDARTGDEIRLDISDVIGLWLTSGLADPPSILLRLRDLDGEVSYSFGLKEGRGPGIDIVWKLAAQRVRP